MHALDGDNIRVSYKGENAARDIVQVSEADFSFFFSINHYFDNRLSDNISIVATIPVVKVLMVTETDFYL